MIRVVIADDHDLVREGMKRVLREEPDIDVVGEAVEGGDVLAALRRTGADVLVLDISMPGPSGLDLLRDIRREFRATAVLIVSMHPEDRFAVRALKGGAAGYLTKEHAGELLAPAVRKLATGGRYITESLAAKLAEDLSDPSSEAPHEQLSSREFEVFLLLARGKSVGEAAEALALGVSTISTYRVRILAKLGLRTNAELTQYAYSHKLLE